MTAMARPLAFVATLALLAGCNVAELPPLPGDTTSEEDVEETAGTADVEEDTAEEDAAADVSEDLVEADVAEDAAEDATADVPGDVAGDATGDAAEDASPDATGDVAGDATGDAAEDASPDAAGDVAGDTAGGADFTCDDVGFEGCCTADGRLAYCDVDGIVVEDCTDTCGWDDLAGFYVCDVPEEGAPDESLPYLCPGEACADPCAGMECGFDCGQACGECAAGDTCEAGACVTP